MRDELPLASFNKGGEGRKLEESELSPRIPLSSVGNSFYAARADTATSWRPLEWLDMAGDMMTCLPCRKAV